MRKHQTNGKTSFRCGYIGEIRTYFLLILVAILAGCATFPIELSKTRIVPRGESAVFGQVMVMIDGKTRNLASWEGPFLVLYLQPSTNPEAYETWVRQKDGYFYWHLPPGTYTLAGYRFMEGNSTYRGRVFAEFSVPEGKPLVYVGNMTLVLGGGRQYIQLHDNFVEAVQNFKEAFPEIQGEATVSLMKMEEKK